MIRAVPFEYYSSGRVDNMAFLDTVTNRFLTIGEEQNWECWDDLRKAMDYEGWEDIHPIRERLRGLCPMWFLDNHEALRTDG